MVLMAKNLINKEVVLGFDNVLTINKTVEVENHNNKRGSTEMFTITFVINGVECPEHTKKHFLNLIDFLENLIKSEAKRGLDKELKCLKPIFKNFVNYTKSYYM
jgi:hypothetical protein